VPNANGKVAPIPVIRVPTIRRLKLVEVVTTRKQTFAPEFCAR
jgi:hypothetical protein